LKILSWFNEFKWILGIDNGIIEMIPPLVAVAVDVDVVIVVGEVRMGQVVQEEG
jgi:hypothetical protein